MKWLIWRQHRVEAAGMALIVALVASMLIPSGLNLHTRHLSGGGDDFLSHYEDITNLLIPYLVVLPAAVGVFVGAPLLGREFDQRTWQLAWSQSVPRTRWLLWKIAVLAPLVVLAVSAVSALFTWWYAPVAAVKGRLDMAFSAQGVVYPAHALFAFALGAFAGAWLRRTMPAMGATIIGYLAVRIPVETKFRMYLLPPKHIVLAPSQMFRNARLGPGGADRVLARGLIDAHGHAATGPRTDAYGNYMTKMNLPDYLARYHLRAWSTYQPADRFWPLQWVEAGIFTALAAALLALLVVRVRRRAV